MNVAIAGIPGAGKSTLALHLSVRFGFPILATGDVARAADPTGVGAGGLADEASFRSAYFEWLAKLAGPVILDGIPRTRGQVELLPNGTRIVVLTCTPRTARARLLLRRRSDDTPVIIQRRIEEQTEHLEARQADGWLYRLVGMSAVFRTDDKTPQEIADEVVEHLGALRVANR